jgi:hypothetical protein
MEVRTCARSASGVYAHRACITPRKVHARTRSACTLTHPTLKQLQPTSSPGAAPASASKPALACTTGAPGWEGSTTAQQDASASAAAVAPSSSRQKDASRKPRPSGSQPRATGSHEHAAASDCVPFGGPLSCAAGTPPGRWCRLPRAAMAQGAAAASATCAAVRVGPAASPTLSDLRSPRAMLPVVLRSQASAGGRDKVTKRHWQQGQRGVRPLAKSQSSP